MRLWYQKEDREVLNEVQSRESGLHSQEVYERQQKYGYNVLPKAKRKTVVRIFFGQFIDPLIFVLIITALISFFLGETIDGIFIFLVISLDAILGTYQEGQAEKNASSLEKMVQVEVNVVRNEKQQQVLAEELVIGDIVLLETGHKVAADMRILSSNNLFIDESVLTGESVPTSKKAMNIQNDLPIAERVNMAYAGSTVMTGRGMGVVVAIASDTELGLIARDVLNTKETKTPLVIRMEKFTKQIGYLIAIIAVVIAFFLYWKGYVIKEIFFSVIALSVAAIPEGLPVSLTVALSIATNRMAKKNVIVRKLNAVESLGSCTVIASDKTGTLTINEQTAKKIVLATGKTYDISGSGYQPEGRIEKTEDSISLNHLLTSAILNTEATLEQKDGNWIHTGDAMDVALLALGKKEQLNLNGSILDRIPYESEQQYSAVLYEEKNEHFAGIKGSLEIILSFCKTMETETGEVPLDTPHILALHDQLAKDGYRVLAFARVVYSEKSLGTLKKEFVFLGLMGFLDPIRKEAPDSIQECRDAGIRILMITGDHPLTATKIATDLNLIQNSEEVTTGAMVEEAYRQGNLVFDEFVKEKQVYSRVTPNQKLQIIESLKRQGEFIAVTGDGVNDAPAMKSANIGIAMGSGTDVAKETASMILIDDNFSSLVAGIEEGRHAYNNVRKVIYLLISCGFAEVIFFLLAILTDLPIPFLAIQLLWLNLVTNGIQDVALAFEKGEPGVMKEKPRPPKEKIFNRELAIETLLSGTVIALIIYAVWFVLNRVVQLEIGLARTYIVLLMVFLQNIHALNCRSERLSIFHLPIRNNYLIIFGILGALVLQFVAPYIPLLKDVLALQLVPFSDIIRLMLAALPLLLIMELYKYWKRKHQTSS